MSTIRTNTLLAADGTQTTEPSIPALDQRMAKAWVNFNGTGTVAIRDSYNVSSITDGGAGQYNVNFLVALNNSNYCISALSRENTGSSQDGVVGHAASSNYMTLLCIDHVGNYEDQQHVYASVLSN